jgi:hypothetical protein
MYYNYKDGDEGEVEQGVGAGESRGSLGKEKKEL